MADAKTTKEAKEQVRSARADLHDDIEALDHHLRIDIPSRVKAKAPLIAAGVGAAGVTAAAIIIAKRRRKAAASREEARRTRKRSAKRNKR